jgi:hypothetical protein
MSKKNGKNRPNPAPRPPSTPTAAATPAIEPTTEQLARLDQAGTQVAALTAEPGPVVECPPEPPGPTLAECLSRVEPLLRDARTHFERAKQREAAARIEEDRLVSEKRAQEEALRQAKRTADEQFAARKTELDGAEAELLCRIEACEAREHATDRRASELDAREATLLETSAVLTERELNAEHGFLAEKLRILATVEASRWSSRPGVPPPRRPLEGPPTSAPRDGRKTTPDGSRRPLMPASLSALNSPARGRPGWPVWAPSYKTDVPGPRQSCKSY